MELKDFRKMWGSRIIESNEIVGFYEFHIEGVEPTLKVKVLKLESGDFMGIANIEVRGKNCATHYRSLHPRKSKEEAVEEAVSGFFCFYSEEADVKEVENW